MVTCMYNYCFHGNVLYTCELGFESLQKLFAKSKSVIEVEGVPRFFIKALAELEDFTREVSPSLCTAVADQPRPSLAMGRQRC